MNIAIVTWDYPDDRRSVFPFVKNLVDEWAKQGHNCTVIAPFSVTNNKRRYCYESNYIINKKNVNILRPNYISLSNFSIGTVRFTEFFHKRAVVRGLKSLKGNPDVIYCHFWRSACEALSYAKKYDIPLIVATGESTIEGICEENKPELFKYLSGVVAVSSKNMKESVALGLCKEEKCIVVPNAIDSRLFNRQEKRLCRLKLSLPQDAYIVAFVGWFNERKGARRVSEAINQINGTPVYSIFVGSGDDEPSCPNILFMDRLQHHEIPLYLNAADAFVLPTQHEGCSNAIVEAMACGLPIISSDLPFNWDICDETNSILVNPNNIEAIKNAIIKLRDNRDLRDKLSLGSLAKAESLTIDKRASRIIEFIKEKTNKK